MYKLWSPDSISSIGLFARRYILFSPHISIKKFVQKQTNKQTHFIIKHVYIQTHRERERECVCVKWTDNTNISIMSAVTKIDSRQILIRSLEICGCLFYLVVNNFHLRNISSVCPKELKTYGVCVCVWYVWMTASTTLMNFNWNLSR